MSLNIELRPFNVPNYVIGAGGREASFRVDEVDADTLAKMCNNFRVAVFAKAGVADPGSPPTAADGVTVTDEMVERALMAYYSAGLPGEVHPCDQVNANNTRRAGMRAALAAAMGVRG